MWGTDTSGRTSTQSGPPATGPSDINVLIFHRRGVDSGNGEFRRFTSAPKQPRHGRRSTQTPLDRSSPPKKSDFPG